MKKLLTILALVAMTTTAQAEDFKTAPVYKELVLDRLSCSDLKNWNKDGWNRGYWITHGTIVPNEWPIDSSHMQAFNIKHRELVLGAAYYHKKDNLYAWCPEYIGKTVIVYKDIDNILEHNRRVSKQKYKEWKTKEAMEIASDFTKLK